MTLQRRRLSRLRSVPWMLWVLSASLSNADDLLPAMARIEPVVVLFVDTSPGMAAIAGHPDYQPDTMYPQWSFQSAQGEEPPALADGPFLDVQDIGAGECPAGFVQGRRGAMTRCLRLPATDDGYRVYETNYLNYLFERFADGTELTGVGDGESIPTESRLSRLKAAAKQLVNLTPGLRHCLTGMNEDGGLQVIHPCEGSTGAMLAAIDNLDIRSAGYSNLAKLYHETIQWIRGLPSADGSTLPSPLRYRCQGIGHVFFTDGYATGDDPAALGGPDALPDDLPPGSRALPDWDGLAPPTTVTDFNRRSLPEFTDGFGGDHHAAGSYLFLDDLAAFGASIDLRGQDEQDDSGHSFGTPWQADQPEPFTHQRLHGFFVSPRESGPVLDDAAASGRGRHLGAGDMDRLARALYGALPRARISRASEGMPVMHQPAGGSALLYAVSYDPLAWTGSIAATPLSLTGAGGLDPALHALWFAEDGIPAHDQRRLFSVRWPLESDESAGPAPAVAPVPIHLEWNEISAAQRASLAGDPSLLGWIQGDPATEMSGGGKWRDRHSLLGDMIHGQPVILPRVGAGSYPDTDHTAYREQRLLVARTPVLFAGANDGLLHAFSAGEQGGQELFAYLPGTLFSRVENLATSPLVHEWMVDGELTLEDARIGDAQFGNPWRTVLVGSLGRGGAGVFAMDVSDVGIPSHPLPPEDVVLWEISTDFPRDRGSGDAFYPDLGQLQQPVSVIRVPQTAGGERWLAVIPNGARSASGNTVLYLAGLTDGVPFQEIVLATDGGGLVVANAVDIDGDSDTDRIYAGDLQGRIWRLDWDAGEDAFVSAYESGGRAVPMFEIGEGRVPSHGFAFEQLPGMSAGDGLLIFFGTDTMTDPRGMNALFGIWDAGDAPLRDHARIAPRTLWETQLGETRIRLASGPAFKFDLTGIRGWRIDLPTPGERILRSPTMLDGRVVFATRADPPFTAPDPCTAAPESWTTEVDALTGLAGDTVTMDINGDGSVDERDRAMDGDIPVAAGGGEDSGNGPVFTRLTGRDGREATVRLEGTLSGEVVARKLPTTLRRFGWRRLYQP